MSATSTSREDADALRYFIERQPADLIREHVTPEDLRACVPLLRMDPARTYVWDKLLVPGKEWDIAEECLVALKEIAIESRKEPAIYASGAQLLQAMCESDAQPYLVPFYQWLHRTQTSESLASPAYVASRMSVAIDKVIERTHASVHDLSIAYALAPYRRTALWTGEGLDAKGNIRADQRLRQTVQLCLEVCVKRARKLLGV